MTATCSYTMHNCGTMAKSVMAICHFCLFKVDARLAVFSSHTNTSLLTILNVLHCHQFFVLQHHSWLSDLTKGISHMSYRCNDSSDSVMYGHATRTSITVDSKCSLEKAGESCMHEQWTAGAPLQFIRAPGNEAIASHV